MISASCRMTEPAGERGLLSRVRQHLQRVPRLKDPGERAHALADLRQLMQRLRRLQAKSAAFRGIDVSESVRDAIQSLEIVGNELLVLCPERKGA